MVEQLTTSYEAGITQPSIQEAKIYFIVYIVPALPIGEKLLCWSYARNLLKGYEDEVARGVAPPTHQARVKAMEALQKTGVPKMQESYLRFWNADRFGL